MLQFEHPCAWLHVAVARLLLQSRLLAHKLEITGTGEAVKLCLSHCTVVKKEEEGEYVNQAAFLKQIVLARLFFSHISYITKQSTGDCFAAGLLGGFY